MNKKSRNEQVLDCNGCGVCCLHMGYPAFNLSLAHLQSIAQGNSIESKELGPAALADKTRWKQMPDQLRSEILQAMESYVPPEKGQLDDACIWLDPETRLCSHHTHRPQVCRDFEIGCDQCLDWREQYQELIQLNG